MTQSELLHEAILEAQLGLSEGGIPIGSVLADSNGTILSRGHNRRIQNTDPTAHAETECIRAAGRRRDWHQLTLVSTLSPCAMCTGTAILFRIPKIIIGENKTFQGAEHWLKESKVSFVVMQDQTCIDLMEAFIKNHPKIWNEDIGL